MKVEQKKGRLTDLDAKIKACGLCRRREQFPEKLPTVQFKGKSNILFVGREPAKNGWRSSGRAFYKPNGELLSSGKNIKKHLGGVGIDIEDINFVELIKCFPSGNETRPPRKEEIENCRHWLDRQVDILQPKVIVSLGKECYEFFRGTRVGSFSSCIEMQERSYYRRIPVIPMFHPSGANNAHNWKNAEILRRIVTEFGR